LEVSGFAQQARLGGAKRSSRRTSGEGRSLFAKGGLEERNLLATQGKTEG